MAFETKKIIMSPEQSTASVGAFFRDMGWEIYTEIEGEDYLKCSFILDDYLPEITNFPRVKTDPDLTFVPEIEKDVRGFFDAKNLDIAQVQNLLHAQFDQGPGYDFIERYSQNLKKVFMIKIHEYLNVGYFIDSMVIEAYKNKFDIDIIRSFLNDSLIAALKEVESNEEQKFIEVSYSFNDQAFAVQISYEKKNFIMEEAYLQKPEKVKELVSRVNFYDVNFFSKRQRLTLSALWFKDQKLKKFKSFFLNETTSKIVESPAVEIQSGLEEKENVLYSPNDQAKKLAVARKIALFIRNYRRNEDNAKPTAALELEDIERYMGIYPRQDALVEIDSELKQFILKLVTDEDLYNGISDVVKKIADTGLDEQTGEIKKILSGKSLADIEEMLIISGKKEDLGGGFTRIKGQAEEQDTHKQVIEGVTQDLSNNEKWELTRNQLTEKIDEEVTRIKAEGRNVLQDDIVKVVSRQLDASEDDVKFIVSGIVEEAVAKDVVKTEAVQAELEPRKVSETTVVQSAAINELQPALKEKLEGQIGRMKKVMEQMKQEMLKLRAENENRNLEAFTTDVKDAEHLKLKNALAKTMGALKAKEKLIEKIRHDHELVIREKDRKLMFLEDRIHEMKQEVADSPEKNLVNTINHLKAEKESLESKLELANKKINIMSENMDNKDDDAQIKKDKEVVTLKASIRMAQTLIERFKMEKIELEAKLDTERALARKYKEEIDQKVKPTLSNHAEADLEKELQTLSQEKKSLEDKNRLQSMELKKLEQKLKFTTSQLEAQLRKKGPQAAAKSNEAYIKQLETASQRIAEATNELSEKRKEIIKLKQENNVLSGKLSDLERKISSSDKKAA